MSDMAVPKRRIDRIQQLLSNEKIGGKIIRIRHVNLFLGPVKCFYCGNIIKSGDRVWRIVVQKPREGFDANVAKTEIRFLGVREYRLCVACEPPPKVPVLTFNTDKIESNDKSD